MAAQPPPYAYPVDPSTGYPTAPQQQPGYPDPAVQQGYPPQTDVKPYQPSGGVDAYGQPIPAGGYPQQPPSYQPYPTGYTAQQQTTTAVSGRTIKAIYYVVRRDGPRDIGHSLGYQPLAKGLVPGPDYVGHSAEILNESYIVYSFALYVYITSTLHIIMIG